MLSTVPASGILCSVVLLASLVVTCYAAVPEDVSTGWFGPEFGVLQKVYDDCQNKNDFTGCLKGKALVALTKAADQVCRNSQMRSTIFKIQLKYY